MVDMRTALSLEFNDSSTQPGMESPMLVLSRKQNERIRVGDSVVVTIVRVSGDKVRIGIEAPPGVRVLRDELRGHSDRDLGRVDGAGISQQPTNTQAIELRLPPLAIDRLLSAAG